MQWPERITKKMRELPDAPGVYLMRGKDGTIIYVGKAASLRRRVQSYFRQSTFRKAPPKLRGLLRSIDRFDFIELRSEEEAMITEGRLIKEYRPRYNTVFKDDKRFILLRVYPTRPFPRVETCRIRKDDRAFYFGPYTSSGAAKAALEFVEKRFGLRRCRPMIPDAQTYQHCNDDIIRDCSAPCIGKISAPAYRERVEEACAFLRGDRPELLKEVGDRMKAASAALDFEQAADLRDLLLRLNQVVREQALVRKTPLRRQTDAAEGLRTLQEKLQLATVPGVIECFDISNISGTLAVASMVCAVNGVPAPQRYRRFRIKTVEGSNDPAMIGEAVARRYRRLLEEKKPFPDLVLVDGGITQLRAARSSLNALGLDALPLAGLAKRNEELVVDLTNKTPALRLPPESPAMTVLRNLRDEAHRFAITYHRELRNRRIKESMLDEIPGIGEKRKVLILQHFGSIARLRRAGEAALAGVPGIGPTTAAHIFSFLNPAS